MTVAEPIDEAEVQSRVSSIATRLDILWHRIAEAGGRDVQVLAVSKGHPVEAVVAAQRLNLCELGENYAQELAAKALAIADTDDPKVKWHFIGQLQTNKVRLIADVVDVWQSVDRLKVGREIAKHAPHAKVYVQVNLSDIEHKGGCSFDELDELVSGLGELGLKVEGLMGVGTAGSVDQTAAGFARLRAAVDRLMVRHCSMGMSGDLELAVANGSTMLRIGSDIFGPRP